MKVFNLHLISDSTGETVSSVSRAAMAQFEGVEFEEHTWSLIRTKGQIDKVLSEIEAKPGFVMYTIADRDLRKHLKEACDEINVPCVSILSRLISDLSGFFGVKASHLIGRQHELDENYFSRVEAINFALTHDDGQSVWDLEEADIVLVGASRTSKSPTSMYLAYRGFRAANVPYVPGVAIPPELENLKGPLIVGLTISPDVLMQIRKNRLLSLKNNENTTYTDLEVIKEELAEARRFFAKHKWLTIDVTRRSVEETSATIIQYFQNRKK